MKIAVFSDTRLPTSHDYGGHGLGHSVLQLAEGLADRGHDVTLFAGPGSSTELRLIVRGSEDDFVPYVERFDAVLDSGHNHQASKIYPDAPIVNRCADIETDPGPNAIFLSESDRRHFRRHTNTGRVIHTGIKAPAHRMTRDKHPYVTYMGGFWAGKQVVICIEAARLAGVKIKLAGPPLPSAPISYKHVEYVGPVYGDAKWNFLMRSSVHLVPIGIRSALEAQSCGTPVLTTPYRGMPEYIAPGTSGYIVRDIIEMAEHIGLAMQLDPENVYRYIVDNHSFERMLDLYEAALMDVVQGMRW
jgi:glycosyltransferase involved in cell wall biosynthesis